MIGLGETVPDLASPTPLRKRMHVGGAGSIPTSVAPQRELSPVVGQHPIKAKRIEPLAVGQEGPGMRHSPSRGHLHRHQASGPIDRHKQIPPWPTQARQRKGIDVQKPGGTGAEPAGGRLGEGRSCEADAVAIGPVPDRLPND